MKSFIVALLVLVAGCAQVTVGRDFDKTKVDRIVKGQTSKEEVLKIFGDPVEKETGLRLERWIYVNRVTSATPRPEWFRLSYRGDVREKRLVIIFNGDTVQDVLFSEHSKPYGSSLGFN